MASLGVDGLTIIKPFPQCVETSIIVNSKGISMNKLIVLAGLGFVFAVSTPVFAGEQQEKMKGCNREAKEGGLKGDERKAFMSKCLKKDYVLKSKAAEAAEDDDASSGAHDEKQAANAAAPVSQKDKMKSCNAEAKAKELKGEERKQFMGSCLKA